MDSSEDEGLFITQSPKKGDISANISADISLIEQRFRTPIELQNARSLTKAWYQIQAAGNGHGF